MAFTENTVVLENSLNDDEVLAQLDLSDKIIAEASTYSCTEKRIDLKLKKQAEDLNWRVLESNQKSAAGGAIPVTVTSGAKPAYPTSSKKKMNWDQLDKEIEKELSNDKPEGDAALNGLFKKIYG